MMKKLLIAVFVLLTVTFSSYQVKSALASSPNSQGILQSRVNLERDYDYPFTRTYDPEILAAICNDRELSKKKSPQPKPLKPIKTSKFKRVYGAQTTREEYQRLIQ
ncbi:hypothetical protein [Crocosphaera sp. Alani8]|uniref:hypothetical protein n=1 Tax=Crocosphaera sp. Alani8 TaxID=3038952 RepID=UPI00313EFCB5